MKTTRYEVLFLLLVVAALPTADHARAQEQEVPQTPEAQLRNVYLAGVIEWIPFVGHAYAGDAARGVLPNIVFFVGVASSVVACRIDTDCGWGREWGIWVMVPGVLTMVGGRLWSMASAMNTAMRTNARLLKERPGTKAPTAALSITPARQLAMGVVLRF